MLTQQLRELERDGIVKRNVYAEVPPKVEYSLTDLGQELRPALHELVMWAASRRKTLDSEKNTHNVVAK
jgi:DNA-binding HxlR family transcriptional regulator